MGKQKSWKYIFDQLNASRIIPVSWFCPVILQIVQTMILLVFCLFFVNKLNSQVSQFANPAFIHSLKKSSINEICLRDPRRVGQFKITITAIADLIGNTYDDSGFDTLTSSHAESNLKEINLVPTLNSTADIYCAKFSLSFEGEWHVILHQNEVLTDLLLLADSTKEKSIHQRLLDDPSYKNFQPNLAYIKVSRRHGFKLERLRVSHPAKNDDYRYRYLKKPNRLSDDQESNTICHSLNRKIQFQACGVLDGYYKYRLFQLQGKLIKSGSMAVHNGLAKLPMAKNRNTKTYFIELKNKLKSIKVLLRN